MKYEDFDKLTAQEKEEFLKNAESLKKQQEVIEKDEGEFKKLSMKDFEAKIKETIEKYIKPMTSVDRKYFAFPGTGKVEDDNTAEGKFTKTTKFLNALVGKDVQTLNSMNSDLKKKANLSEGVAEAGGYLVPEEFKSEILRLAPIYGVLRQNCRIIPMRRDTMTIPAAGGTQLTAHFVNEAGTIASTDPNFGMVTLICKKLAAIPKVTEELMEDADIPIIQYLAELIAEAFAKREDEEGFLGTGSPFIGVCESTASPSRAVCASTISSLSYPDLMLATGDLYSNAKAGAKWYIHRSIKAHLKSLITTAGSPIFPTLNDIDGYPVQEVEALRSITTMGASDGTCFGIFGDLRRGYAMGDRALMTMKMSSEATVGNDNLFEQDMQALKATERIAMGVLLGSYWLKLTT